MEMERVSGGSWGCAGALLASASSILGYAFAGAILFSVSLTLRAAAIAVGRAGAGVLILGYGITKLGATAAIIGSCGDM